MTSAHVFRDGMFFDVNYLCQWDGSFLEDAFLCFLMLLEFLWC